MIAVGGDLILFAIFDHTPASVISLPPLWRLMGKPKPVIACFHSTAAVDVSSHLSAIILNPIQTFVMKRVNIVSFAALPTVK